MLAAAFCVRAQTANVTLAWNASQNLLVAGYRLYQGLASGKYSTNLSVGNYTNVTISGLLSGTNYYFAVTEVAANGLESPYSGEISYAVAPAAGTNPPPPAPPPAPVLPQPWVATDIGNVGLAGKSSGTNSSFAVTGAGGLNGSADALQFLYQPMLGDGQITAQISGLQATGTGARAGVMLRETLSPGSAYVFLGISPDGTLRWQRRRSTATTASTSSFGQMTNGWVRIVRTGNTFSAYQSADGNAWTAVVGKNNLTMANNISMGLAVASGATNSPATGTFTNVQAIP